MEKYLFLWVCIIFIISIPLIRKLLLNDCSRNQTINDCTDEHSNQTTKPFDKYFKWREIEGNLFFLTPKIPTNENIYLIVSPHSISFHKVEGFYGEMIEYRETGIESHEMFRFEISKKIEDEGKKFEFKYPREKGYIRILSKDILSIIDKDDFFSKFKIRIDENDFIMEFDCREESKIQIEEKREQARIELNKREFEERKQREDKELREKILARERKKRKEKEIYNQLLDEGLIYSDESNKRPPIPREVVDAVWRRDKGQCVYCGSKENLQLDHIIPFSKGGATTFENLQLLCQKCNLKKSNNIG